MKFKRLTLLMISLLFVLSISSFAFALEPVPGFCYFSGEVRDTGGDLVSSGEVRAYIDGQVVLDNEGEEIVESITGGQFNITVSGNFDGKTVDFKVTADGTQYTATANKALVWQDWGTVESVVLVIDKAATPEIPATPTASPNPDSYENSVDVALDCVTEGADIYYTKNGTTPDLTSSQYSGVVNLTADTTIKAKAYKDGQWSQEAVFQYTITHTQASPAAPTASPAPGEFTNSVNVQLSCEQGAQIFYTLDGTNPKDSLSSILYNGAFDLNVTTTVKAVAFKNGLYSQDIATLVYTLAEQQGPVNSIEVTLENEKAVNVNRPLEINAKAFKDSEPANVFWFMRIKDENSQIIDEPEPDIFNSETTVSWQPTADEIREDLPVTRNYTLEVEAGFASEVINDVQNIILSNYSLVIAEVKYEDGIVKATLENLDEATVSADCIFQIEKIDGTFVDLNAVNLTVTGSGNETAVITPVLSSGTYKVTVFLWNMGNLKTLANPAETTFVVAG